MYEGAREKPLYGTLQISPVTSEEGVPISVGHSKLGLATVYQKHSSLQSREDDV